MVAGGIQCVQEVVMDEPTRQEGCKQVVLAFASAFGYISRNVMSKEELEHKIYIQKATPADLQGELHQRMNEIPGITLGYRSNSEIKLEIKLPFSMRDRHVYIIGRSGVARQTLSAR